MCKWLVGHQLYEPFLPSSVCLWNHHWLASVNVSGSTKSRREVANKFTNRRRIEKVRFVILLTFQENEKKVSICPGFLVRFPVVRSGR